MQRLIYIHGFLSSPQSMKAQLTKSWLAQHYPDIEYVCPALSSYPEEARATLVSLAEERPGAENCLIGSSLGGFWASYLVEQGLAEKAVLVNPAVSPHTRFTELVGQELQSYYSDACYKLGQHDLDVLAACETDELKYPERYWLMAQTGDEVLDYRLATERYQRCKQLVEQGGNHSFEGFERWLPDILHFFLEHACGE